MKSASIFHFTIRDVLGLTVVVAVSVGWFLTTRRLADVESKYKPLQATVDAMQERAAKAKMDEQFRNAYDGPSRRASQPR